MPKTKKSAIEFALCITNSEADLQKGKVYKLLPDESASKNKHVRVVDDSGEDYLYPAVFFVKIELPQEAKRAMLRAS
jgi:hypothetical protein